MMTVRVRQGSRARLLLVVSGCGVVPPRASSCRFCFALKIPSSRAFCAARKSCCGALRRRGVAASGLFRHASGAPRRGEQ